MIIENLGDPEVRQVLGDDSYVATLLAVEAATARAQARLGLIPTLAADKINSIDAAAIDRDALARGIAQSGFPIIALVAQLKELVGPESARFVHWGATTQDIMDTAQVLQVRSACDIYQRQLKDITQNLAILADRHRLTIMAGRTHGQQALPLTFGLKAASWLAPLVRHQKRFRELAPRLFVVQFGGAAGTLAALNDKGLAVGAAVAAELGLAPALPWHSQRDSLVEFAGWLSMVTGTLGKMAQDVILLAQTEVDEVQESANQDSGGSSSMPQKRNPITSELIVAIARQNATLLSAMHHSLIQEHERGTHGWQVEWLSLPQMMVLTGGSLRHARELTRNLQVNAQVMRANITRALDVVLAEAAVITLTTAMPKNSAETLVKNASRLAASQNRPLIEVVKGLAPDADIDWSSLAQPENYLGQTQEIIDAILKSARDL